MLAGVEALHLGKAHVIGIQGIGDHQMRFAGGIVGFPVGQVVVIGIAVVQKAAFFHHQAPGIGTGAAGVPTQRAFAADFGEDADGFEHVFTLLRFIHVLVVDPAITVAADLVPGLDHGADHIRMALGGHCHGKHRERNIELAKQLEDAPHACTAAVLIQRLHAHVALALQWLG